MKQTSDNEVGENLGSLVNEPKKRVRKTKKQSEKEIMNIFIQICEGLRYLH